jgi:hypothetical protein
MAAEEFGGAAFPFGDGAVDVRADEGVVARAVEDQPDALVARAQRGLVAGLVMAGEFGGLAEQVDEDRHLGAQHHRVERLGHVVDRAERIGLLDREVGAVGGGQEDDRQLLRTGMAPHQRGRLEAVHGRHLDVEQHDRKGVVEHRAQGLLAGTDADQFLVKFGEHGFERQQVGRLVVDQQDLDSLLIHLLSARLNLSRFV